MSIKINTKPTDITIYDKVNLNHALSKDVVPLLTTIREDFKTTLVNIISNSLYLIDSEKELYIALLYNDYRHYGNNLTKERIVDLYVTVNTLSLVNNKSNITYRRAADTLIKLGVIKYSGGRRMCIINTQYNTNVVNEVAKYIVIEVNNPGVRSEVDDVSTSLL